jgi:hypothetical protein
LGSFEFLWKSVAESGILGKGIFSMEFLVTIILFVATTVFLMLLHKVQPDHSNRPLEYLFVFYFIHVFFSRDFTNRSTDPGEPAAARNQYTRDQERNPDRSPGDFKLWFTHSFRADHLPLL